VRRAILFLTTGLVTTACGNGSGQGLPPRAALAAWDSVLIRPRQLP